MSLVEWAITIVAVLVQRRCRGLSCRGGHCSQSWSNWCRDDRCGNGSSGDGKCRSGVCNVGGGLVGSDFCSSVSDLCYKFSEISFCYGILVRRRGSECN